MGKAVNNKASDLSLPPSWPSLSRKRSSVPALNGTKLIITRGGGENAPTGKKTSKNKRNMEVQEIIKAAEMYNRIMEAIQECEKVNKANNYNGDLLWVMCNGGTHYTNEMCDIMPSVDEEKFYRCKNLKETAAKFTALCLEAGCSPDDIFTDY